jgi:stage IV sporulation protein FB
VYLLEPNRTEFDLSWRMFGVKVRVHPMFWLLAAVLGWNFLQVGFEYFFIFIGCAFVSILFHELGHVFMGRLFGRDSHIVLYSFGGLAISYVPLPSRWQRIAVAFAGPLAGFILLGAAWLFLRYGLIAVDPEEKMPLLKFTVDVLIGINLVWNLLNLVPIWPLDGGQISREIFTWLAPRNGLRLSLGFSFLLAGLFAVQALSSYYGGPRIPYLGWLYGPYTALLFGLLAFQSFQLLQQAERNPWREDWPDRDDWH